MQEVIKKCKLLNEQIKQTEEYRHYIETRRALHENPDLFNRLKEFRRRNYELQHRVGVNPFDEVNCLVRENDDLLHNSIVCDFNKAEQHFCSMMRQMFETISEGLEFDYLDE